MLCCAAGLCKRQRVGINVGSSSSHTSAAKHTATPKTFEVDVQSALLQQHSSYERHVLRQHRWWETDQPVIMSSPGSEILLRPQAHPPVLPSLHMVNRSGDQSTRCNSMDLCYSRQYNLPKFSDSSTLLPAYGKQASHDVPQTRADSIESGNIASLGLGLSGFVPSNVVSTRTPAVGLQPIFAAAGVCESSVSAPQRTAQQDAASSMSHGTTCVMGGSLLQHGRDVVAPPSLSENSPLTPCPSPCGRFSRASTYSNQLPTSRPPTSTVSDSCFSDVTEPRLQQQVFIEQYRRAPAAAQLLQQLPRNGVQLLAPCQQRPQQRYPQGLIGRASSATYPCYHHSQLPAETAHHHVHCQSQQESRPPVDIVDPRGCSQHYSRSSSGPLQAPMVEKASSASALSRMHSNCRPDNTVVVLARWGRTLGVRCGETLLLAMHMWDRVRHRAPTPYLIPNVIDLIACYLPFKYMMALRPEARCPTPACDSM